MISKIQPEDIHQAINDLKSGAHKKCWVGFDGFIDEIFRVVDQRTQQHPSFMHSIGQLAQRIPSSGSANIEIVSMQQRIGGNATQLALGLAQLQQPCTLTACVGEGAVDALFQELCCPEIELITLAAPALTRALEFRDGKLMLGEMRSLLSLDWDLLCKCIGAEQLASLWGSAHVVATVNWTMTPALASIWQQLGAISPGPQWLFVDLCDPAKRSDSELRSALNILSSLNCKVVLGLNQAESLRLARLLGIPADVDVAGRAQALAQAAGIACVVIHTREACGLAYQNDVWLIELKPISSPKTLTGAGDRFNAGLLFGLLNTDSFASALCFAVAVSRSYVRTGTSANMDRLQAELHAMLAIIH